MRTTVSPQSRLFKYRLFFLYANIVRRRFQAERLLSMHWLRFHWRDLHPRRRLRRPRHRLHQLWGQSGSTPPKHLMNRSSKKSMTLPGLLPTGSLLAASPSRTATARNVGPLISAKVAPKFVSSLSCFLPLMKSAYFYPGISSPFVSHQAPVGTHPSLA